MQRVRDLPAMKKLAKHVEAGVITPAQEKFIDACEEIRKHPGEGDPAFMARQLVQCTLPHTDPGNIPRWMRRNGSLSLVIQPGWDATTDSAIGYPYGTIPRLLLFWINTEAVKTHSRRLNLGNNLAQFLREIGLDPNTGRGKRGDATRLREQMTRLFYAKISFQQSQNVTSGIPQRWMNMDVAPEGELWWDPKRPEQNTLWNSWIELGEKFFQAIIASPVPCDMRALRALKRSPLALDLYSLLNYRGFVTAESGKSQFIAWQLLMTQLGAEYEDINNFRKKASAALRKVKLAQPGLKVDKVTGGIEIYPSRAAIASRRYM